MHSLSDTASSIITLLHNANELIVKSSDRVSAKEVLQATKLYADNKKFAMPEEKIDNFMSILIDARPITLTTLLKDIAEDVLTADTKSRKKKFINPK